MAELLAALDPEAAIPPPPPAWPDWSDPTPAGWGAEEPWRSWVELLRAETHAAEPDPERRVRLALLARAQGRDADAWRHLRAAGPHPLVAAVLPALLPGVPSELVGRDAPLPPGVLLRPALPPATHDPRGSLRELAGRVMEHRRVRVGETLVSLRVLVEGDGVQVDLVHKSGPPVELRVEPPVPPGVEIGLLYADWERVDDGTVAVGLRLSAEEPRHTIWGRFRSRHERWPAPLPRATGVPRPRVPLRLVVPAGAERTPRLARFAEALSELFGLACELREGDRAPDGGLFEPTTLHLGDGPDAERKLVAMISLVEAHALAGAAR